MKYLKNVLVATLIMFTIFMSTACATKIPEGYLPEAESGMMFDCPEFKYFYNYAPTVIVEGDKAHIWYCTNIVSSKAADHIAYRQGVKSKGVWYWSEESIVLYPGEKGSWDQKHICDPC